jgi:hypothetical protein
MSLKYMEKRCSKRRQAGMTTLGLIILVSFLGLFAFAGIRLTPVYLNYMKVVGVIDGVDEEFDGTGATSTAIRTWISRRFDIESVAVITAKDVTVKKTTEGYEVAAAYSHKAPFIANVSFLVDFDKRTTVRR